MLIRCGVGDKGLGRSDPAQVLATVLAEVLYLAHKYWVCNVLPARQWGLPKKGGGSPFA